MALIVYKVQAVVNRRYVLICTLIYTHKLTQSSSETQSAARPVIQKIVSVTHARANCHFIFLYPDSVTKGNPIISSQNWAIKALHVAQL